MRVRTKDLALALETIGTTLEAVDVSIQQDEFDNSTLKLLYQDANKRVATITLFDAGAGITPEQAVVSKLYKK